MLKEVLNLTKNYDNLEKHEKNEAQTSLYR